MLDQLQADLKQAQLNRDEIKVSVLRMLLSELKYVQINNGQDLTDADVTAQVQKELKKRREAVEGFLKGGREELAEKEKQEAAVLEAYLPAQLGDEELTKIVDETIAETGASTIADMGKVISSVMAKVSGQAEGARVSLLVKQQLLA